MESESVKLFKNDLNGIVRTRRCRAAIMANIFQSLFFAFV